eukprot:12825200-Heterocapsa_arctica.AAC.1
MRGLETGLSLQEMDAIFARFDRDQSGYVDINEFCHEVQPAAHFELSNETMKFTFPEPGALVGVAKKAGEEAEKLRVEEEAAKEAEEEAAPKKAEEKVEEELCWNSQRFKLYRFRDGDWEERGPGEAKLPKHRVTGNDKCWVVDVPPYCDL